MTTNALDHGSPRTVRRRVSRSAVAVVASGLALVSLFIPLSVRRMTVRMDAVTGSMQRQTTWFGCFTCTPRFDTSPLETRLKQSDITWTPAWQFLHDYDYNVAGSRLGVGCGRAPEIYSLRFGFLDEFVKSADDAALRQFVNVMQTGSELEQRQTIMAITEKMSRSP